MLGDACWRLGRFERAVASYRKTRRLLAHDPVTVSEMLLKEAAVLERLGRYPRALAMTTRARTVLDGVEGPTAARQLAKISVEYATTLETQGRNRRAIAWCERAIEEAMASGDQESVPQAYLVMGYAHQNLGMGDAADYYRRALEGFEMLGDRAGQGLMLNNLGVTAYYAGRWDEAVDLWRRGAEMRAQLGDVVNAAYGIVNVGEVDADQGRIDLAEESFRHALRIWRASGFGWGIAYATLNLGRTACRRGEFDRGLELLASARDQMRTLGASEEIEAEARMAEGLVLAGRPDDALEVIDGMRQGEVLRGEAVQMPLLERVRGYAALQRVEHDEARAHLERSLTMARERDQPLDVALALHAITELDRLAGGSVNLVAAEESEEILRGLGVESVPEVPTSVGTSG